MKSNLVPLIIFCLIIFICGLVCLIWPKNIQQYYTKIYNNSSRIAKLNPFSKWMEKLSYILYLRFIGVFLLIICVLLIYAATRLK